MAKVQKPSWQTRVKSTENFHKSKLRQNHKWRIEDTAKELNRSEGRICEDLMLASWLKTHPAVADFEYIEEALRYVRAKKKAQRLA